MPCWYYDKDEFQKTPSQADGIDQETEARYRKEGARFIIDAGNKLGLRYDTCATGVVYFHRFYMYHSFREFHRYVMGACCLFLAGKVEETPKKCKDIIKTARSMLPDQHFMVFGEDPKEEVITMERILLQTIKFDLQVDHPYSFLLRFAKGIKGDKQKVQKMVQMAWTFINDGLCTTLCLEWEPDIVAVALIYLASRLSKFDITDWEGRVPGTKGKWWEHFVEDATLELLEDICHRVLDLYSSNPQKRAESPPMITNRTPEQRQLLLQQQQALPVKKPSTPPEPPQPAKVPRQDGSRSSSVTPTPGAKPSRGPSTPTSPGKPSHYAGQQPVEKPLTPQPGPVPPQGVVAGTPGGQYGSVAQPVGTPTPGQYNPPYQQPPPALPPQPAQTTYSSYNPYMSSQMYTSSFMSQEGSQDIKSLINQASTAGSVGYNPQSGTPAPVYNQATAPATFSTSTAFPQQQAGYQQQQQQVPYQQQQPYPLQAGQVQYQQQQQQPQQPPGMYQQPPPPVGQQAGYQQRNFQSQPLPPQQQPPQQQQGYGFQNQTYPPAPYPQGQAPPPQPQGAGYQGGPPGQQQQPQGGFPGQQGAGFQEFGNYNKPQMMGPGGFQGQFPPQQQGPEQGFSGGGNMYGQGGPPQGGPPGSTQHQHHNFNKSKARHSALTNIKITGRR
ncbi:cyclin-K isoform X2 [Lingula anatina]|uniref:Cyclin-K isoform X2 n=1 Tax=Lingula anatina TaxID=7574 RepID=A0A1S3IL67_LINAN|nr:cyclin-K isoform X3 [Lingula anatina]XP_013398264.1 cyclin-K isoform X2 [Lingula anatina]|eukprot:XP_013398263.1 cyclin-K isoform X3 [Lingula anatina]